MVVLGRGEWAWGSAASTCHSLVNSMEATEERKKSIPVLCSCPMSPGMLSSRKSMQSVDTRMSACCRYLASFRVGMPGTPPMMDHGLPNHTTSASLQSSRQGQPLPNENVVAILQQNLQVGHNTHQRCVK
eukprot:1191395-Prorocentrum_minimum.AAC.12